MKYILGIDIGGTKCAAIIADKTGTIIARQQIATNGAPEEILDSLRTVAGGLLSERSIATDSLIGCGISCGGPLDRIKGIIQKPPNLPLWDEIPVKSYFEKHFQTEARLENDANATALAEYRLGAGKGYKNIAFCTMGTGVGAGIILNGELYHGRNDLAGEIGHTVIVIDGPLCGCGKYGCLEALASGPSVARQARESLAKHPESGLANIEADKITAKDIVEFAKKGDGYAKELLSQAGFYMGIGIANLLQTLNLEAVVLGTLAVHAGDLLLNPIRESVRKHAWKSVSDGVVIVPAGLGDTAQDYAAVALWL